MSNPLLESIEILKEKIRPLEEQVTEGRKLINMLCKQAGVPMAYADIEMPGAAAVALRGDEYHNKPLNTAIKLFLEFRKAAGRGPVSAEEIHDGLIAGGYAGFPSNREEALTGLRISLGKSSHTFTRLPSGLYGLASWYGGTTKRVKIIDKGNGKPDDDKGNSKSDDDKGSAGEATDTATPTDEQTA